MVNESGPFAVEIFGREAGEVIREAADQLLAGSLFVGREAFFAEGGEDEGIDRIGYEGVLDFRDGNILHRLVGPIRCIGFMSGGSSEKETDC